MLGTVHACENGLLACEAVVRERPDVILLDWMMPVMDGRAAVERLKADIQTRGIPIVMLTAQSEIDERVVALEEGVQDFLTKPFDARELIARIEQQLRWRKMLAVDANTAFAGERLQLYRSYETAPASASQGGDSASSIFDRIWGAEPEKIAKEGHADEIARLCAGRLARSSGQVPCGEGAADHAGPESCAAHRAAAFMPNEMPGCAPSD